MSRKEPKVRNHVSLINWILTVLATSIPGVNIIACILFIIFGRSRAKRRFAAAWLIVFFLFVVAVVAVLIAFPDAMRSAAEWLREYARTQLDLTPPTA